MTSKVSAIPNVPQVYFSAVFSGFVSALSVLDLYQIISLVPPPGRQNSCCSLFLWCPHNLSVFPSSIQHNTWYTGGDIKYLLNECPPLFSEFKPYPTHSRPYLSNIKYSPNRKHFPFIFTLTDLLINECSLRSQSHSFSTNYHLCYVGNCFICLNVVSVPRIWVP